MNAEQCPVCEKHLEAGLFEWHLKCPACHYEGSTLGPVINSSPAHELIDEAQREHGLRTLRTQNFQTLLARIKALKNQGDRLLEVGSAHGWFLELARLDFEVTGIEPDRNILDSVDDKTLPIRCGYFPQVLNKDERFDVIVFNDVIEHIPDIKTTLSMCHQHLNEGGLLVLNLPNSDGFFYRLAKFLAKCSLGSPFNRLWQKGLPSPHVHYFNPANLNGLLNQHGFDIKEKGRLPTLVRQGLHARISLAKGLGPVARNAIYLSVLTALPVLQLLPGDIFYSISQRRTG
jgi:2-polyprenyl-3-methyl-5-hydroxy-6-metoxy-1,4-benzoquinol methylase